MWALELPYFKKILLVLIILHAITRRMCHQRNHLTSEKETLILLLSLQHSEVYIGSTITPVKVFTDCNPLVFINKMKNSQYTITTRYV